MELNEYQKKAMTTCTESSENFGYMMLNLVGEVGELSSKIAKGIRKRQISIGLRSDKDMNNIFFNADESESDEYKRGLMLEAGDVLWQLSGLCSVMGWSLEEVAEANLSKLSARKMAGTIVGNGDGICGKDRIK